MCLGVVRPVLCDKISLAECRMVSIVGLSAINRPQSLVQTILEGPSASTRNPTVHCCAHTSRN